MILKFWYLFNQVRNFLSIPNNFGEGELHNASIEYTKFDADNTQMSAAERLRICEMFRGLTLYGFSIVLGI